MGDGIPVDEGSKEATLTALATDFQLSEKVPQLFAKVPMEDLEDFRSTSPRRRTSILSWRRIHHLQASSPMGRIAASLKFRRRQHIKLGPPASAASASRRAAL